MEFLGAEPLDCRKIALQVMQRGLTHCDSVYRFPNFCAVGRLCKTNWMSSTAFRGFGGPQGMFLTESCIVDAAYTFGMEPEKVGTVTVGSTDCDNYGSLF